MPCDPSVFEDIPIFSLLDADERAVLAEQVELRRFPPRQRVYKAGDSGGKAYLVLKGQVQVIVIDDDNQEVVIDSPRSGEMFGLASMLSAAAHQTTAVALEETMAIEIERNDIAALLQRKPLAGLDMLTMVGRQFHAAQDLVRMRAARNPNEVIAEQLTTRLGQPAINLIPVGAIPNGSPPAGAATIGARTEHFRIAKAANGTAVGKVNWIEHLGDQNHLHLTVGDRKLVTLVDPSTDLAAGDGVSLTLVDPLYFDASGNRIRGR